MKILSKLDTTLSKKSQTFIKNVIEALLVEPLGFWGFPLLAIKNGKVLLTIIYSDSYCDKQICTIHKVWTLNSILFLFQVC